MHVIGLDQSDRPRMSSLENRFPVCHPGIRLRRKDFNELLHLCRTTLKISQSLLELMSRADRIVRTPVL
jgi:hypothetical protein